MSYENKQKHHTCVLLIINADNCRPNLSEPFMNIVIAVVETMNFLRVEFGKWAYSDLHDQIDELEKERRRIEGNLCSKGRSFDAMESALASERRTTERYITELDNLRKLNKVKQDHISVLESKMNSYDKDLRAEVKRVLNTREAINASLKLKRITKKGMREEFKKVGIEL